MPNLKPLNPSDIQVVNNMVAFSANTTSNTAYFNSDYSDFQAVSGYNMISGDTMKFYSAQRVPNNGRPFSNLFHSFKFPLTSADTNSGWVNAGYNGSYMSAITSTQGTGEEFIVMEIPSCLITIRTPGCTEHDRVWFWSQRFGVAINNFDGWLVTNGDHNDAK